MPYKKRKKKPLASGVGELSDRERAVVRDFDAVREQLNALGRGVWMNVRGLRGIKRLVVVASTNATSGRFARCLQACDWDVQAGVVFLRSGGRVACTTAEEFVRLAAAECDKPWRPHRPKKAKQPAGTGPAGRFVKGRRKNILEDGWG